MLDTVRLVIAFALSAVRFCADAASAVFELVSDGLDRVRDWVLGDL